MIYIFQNSRFLSREVGGLPRDFQSLDGLMMGLRQMMEDSHGRTSSFDEFAEILADVLYKSETRSKQVKKALNGKFLHKFI